MIFSLLVVGSAATPRSASAGQGPCLASLPRTFHSHRTSPHLHTSPTKAGDSRARARIRAHSSKTVHETSPPLRGNASSNRLHARSTTCRVLKTHARSISHWLLRCLVGPEKSAATRRRPSDFLAESSGTSFETKLNAATLDNLLTRVRCRRWLHPSCDARPCLCALACALSAVLSGHLPRASDAWRPPCAERKHGPRTPLAGPCVAAARRPRRRHLHRRRRHPRRPRRRRASVRRRPRVGGWRRGGPDREPPLAGAGRPCAWRGRRAARRTPNAAAAAAAPSSRRRRDARARRRATGGCRRLGVARPVAAACAAAGARAECAGVARTPRARGPRRWPGVCRMCARLVRVLCMRRSGRDGPNRGADRRTASVRAPPAPQGFCESIVQHETSMF